MLTIITIVFILSVALSTLYWLVLFMKMLLYKVDTNYSKKTNFSIILCAKNELKCLTKNLHKLISQKNASQVVLMDDYSTDGSSTFLKKTSESNKILNVKKPSQNVPGKKLALTEGIAFSKNENLVLTDGDCWPKTQLWATKMSAKLDASCQIVLGYGPLKTPNSLLGIFIQFETVINAIQYFSYALFKNPYMGVGRNIAFTKKIFSKINGYTDHIDHISGDDDLLVQSAMKYTQIAICIDPDTFVYSKSPRNFRSYVGQKKRHLSTAPLYSLQHKILLSLHPFFHLMGSMMALVLLYQGLWTIVVIAYLLRWFALMTFGFIPFKKLEALKSWATIPLCDILLVPFYIFFSLISILEPKHAWH